MYKLFLLITLFLPSVVLSMSADELVKEADKYRQSSDNLKVSSVIKLYKNNELDRERAYDVYLRSGRQSLVLSKSPSEKGQKVLMLKDSFWLLMPKSKRPIRITPMQKLLGEASTGDVATMSWHEDYDAKFITKYESSENGNNILELTAKTKGVTYKRIVLSLAPKTNFPVEAELYLPSGKLAKIAHFVLEKENGELRVVKMIIKDRINKTQHTEIEYLQSTPYTLNNKFYNPSYLARNPALNIR